PSASHVGYTAPYGTDEPCGLDTSINPVGGGDHHPDAHTASADGYPTHPGQIDSSRWPDMTARELAIIIPLVALTIFAGVYPKPLFEIMEPSLQAILDGALRVVGN